MIPYPIADINLSMELSPKNGLESTLQSFLSTRARYILAQQKTAWKYILNTTATVELPQWNTVILIGSIYIQLCKSMNYEIDERSLPDLMIAIIENKLPVRMDITIELFGCGIANPSESVAESELARNHINTGEPFLAEQLELSFYNDPFVYLAFSLTEAADFKNELQSGDTWSTRYLDFCRYGLKKGLFECVWN